MIRPPLPKTVWRSASSETLEEGLLGPVVPATQRPKRCVDTAELSPRPDVGRAPRNAPAAMPQVPNRINAAGEWPGVVDDDGDLRSNDGARWRFVAEVETRMEGRCARRGLMPGAVL